MTECREAGTHVVLALAVGDPVPASASVQAAARTVPALLRGITGQGVTPGPVTLLTPPALAAEARSSMPVGVRVRDSAHPAADIAELLAVPGPDAVLVGHADVVVSGPPLGGLLDDPRVGTGVLCAPATAGGVLRVEGGRVTGPGQDHALLGLARVAAADRAAAARGLRAAADDRPAGADPVVGLVAGLLREGVPVQAVPLGSGYVWDRPAPPTADASLAVAGGVDEHRVRLRNAVRGDDGWLSSTVLRRISPHLTGVALRLGLTPNAVTLGSFALGLGAAGCLAQGGRPAALAGAALLQASILVDCVDGELARYRRRFSRFGAWLDALTDRVKEFAVVVALAAGAARSGDGDLWLLAGAAVALQTFRSLADLAWSQQRQADAAAQSAQQSAQQPAPVPAGAWPDAAGAPVLAAERGPGVLTWLRRIGHFPIAERFLVLSAAAALGAPREGLVVLVAAGVLATAYQLGAFAVRARPVAGPAPRVLALLDAAPALAPALRRAARRAGRAAVLLPAGLAVAEIAAVLALTGASPAGAALAAAVAVAHYQHAYGVREGGGSGRTAWNSMELRLALLALLTLGPFPAGAPALLAAGVLAATAASGLRGWRRDGKRPALTPLGQPA